MPLGFLLANQSCLHWIIKCAIESRGWYSFSSFGLRMLFHLKVLCLRLMSPLLCCNNVITATDVTATEKTFCDSGLIHLCFCHGASSGASVGFAFRWPSWCSKWCNSDRNTVVPWRSTPPMTPPDVDLWLFVLCDSCSCYLHILTWVLHGLQVWLVVTCASGLLRTTCFDF